MISKSSFADMMLKGTGVEINPVIQVWADDLVPFHTGDLGHVFDVEYDSDMKELEKSILEEGQLEPVIVRPDTENGKYEVIVGHRRHFIAEKNKLPLDALVRDMTDEDAIKLMVLSNLAKRSKIKPMTYAKAIKVYVDANKKQGKRRDLTQGEEKGDTITEIADEIGLSKSTARRLMRLTNLIPELQEQVDEGDLPVGVGVELSYLTEKEQTNIYQDMDSNPKHKMSLELAKSLHEESIDRQKNKKQGMSEVELMGKLEPAPRVPKFILNEKYLTEFLPDFMKEKTTLEKAEYIVNALKAYEV